MSKDLIGCWMPEDDEMVETHILNTRIAGRQLIIFVRKRVSNI